MTIGNLDAELSGERAIQVELADLDKQIVELEATIKAMGGKGDTVLNKLSLLKIKKQELLLQLNKPI